MACAPASAGSEPAHPGQLWRPAYYLEGLQHTLHMHKDDACSAFLFALQGTGKGADRSAQVYAASFCEQKATGQRMGKGTV
eukprot:1147118-Pelagomonas_calceolata.AAC.2